MGFSGAAAQVLPDKESGPKRMKGIGFVNVRQYVLDRHGPAQWDKTLARLDEKDRTEVNGVVAVGWYDTYLFARVLYAVDAVCGRGDLGILKDVGRYEAEHDYNRALRMLLRVLSPSSIFTGHARLWGHFQDSGRWEFKSKAFSTAGTLRGWATDAALCVELSGYLERMVEFTGGKNVTVTHAKCRATGAEECVFDFRWT